MRYKTDKAGFWAAVEKATEKTAWVILAGWAALLIGLVVYNHVL